MRYTRVKRIEDMNILKRNKKLLEDIAEDSLLSIEKLSMRGNLVHYSGLLEYSYPHDFYEYKDIESCEGVRVTANMEADDKIPKKTPSYLFSRSVVKVPLELGSCKVLTFSNCELKSSILIGSAETIYLEYCDCSKKFSMQLSGKVKTLHVSYVDFHNDSILPEAECYVISGPTKTSNLPIVVDTLVISGVNALLGLPECSAKEVQNLRLEGITNVLSLSSLPFKIGTLSLEGLPDKKKQIHSHITKLTTVDMLR